jgi:hypothetical protein
MALELWTSGELYQTLRDPRMDPVPSWIMDTWYATKHFSRKPEILFSELPANDRKMAPFVAPTEQGKPIFGVKGETVKSFRPAYIKPKDAVRPADAITPLPSEILTGQELTQEQRFDLRTIQVQAYHRRAIMMQWAWMCARAHIDAKLTIKYERDSGQPNPEVTIDYGRAANQTVVLTGSSTDYWDDPDYDILGDLEDWMKIMYLAPFGGSAAQLIVGARVAPIFRNNKGIKAMLDKDVRGNEDVQINLGIMRTVRPLTRIGQLTTGLEVLTYKDQVQNDDGSMIDLLDERDVMLVAPGAEGILAFGAIQDVKAMENGQNASVDIFPKMFESDDPSEIYLMSQSSPLPIPLYPNRTFKARVLK